MEMTVQELLKYSPDFKDFEDWFAKVEKDEYFVKVENHDLGYLIEQNNDGSIGLGAKNDALRFSMESAEIYSGEQGDIELVGKIDYFNIYRRLFDSRFEGLKVK